MEWKNQLTRTPYLVLFVVLIAVGVGTASALITITLSGNVHVTGDTTMDGTLGVGTATPDAAFHVVGGGSDFTPNKQGVQITGSDASNSPGIELTGNGEPPYIDFQNDITGTDFDGRIILTDDDTLSITGADLAVDGDLYLAGPLSNDDDRIRFDDGSEVLFWDDSQSKFRLTSNITCPNCILGFYWIETKIAVQQFEVDAGFASRTALCDDGDFAISAMPDSGFSNPVTIRTVVAGNPGFEDRSFAIFTDLNLGEGIGVNGICADYTPAHIP